ncbi:Rieske 2Fe-2S domain-containing protein [Candidatus Poribacteria bacterium]|nr:Rieske 2Fe-2S domain-containing protein [Candidatus Poribacteria bacterium]
MREDKISRRSFLGRALRWTGLGFLASLAGCLWRYLSPRRISEPISAFNVGFPDEYKPESVSDRWVKSPYKVWIIRREDGTFYALYDECTHLGCALRWEPEEKRFKCPCHKSQFDMEGHLLKGPASRALDRVAIKLDITGEIRVDTSRRFRFERGEWKDPDSFLKI